MKRIVLTTALALAMGSMASAQKFTESFEFFNSTAVSFPTDFSYDGKPRLILWDNSEESYMIYDENLNVEKIVKMKNLSFDYNLQIKTEEREIKSVDISNDRVESTYNYDEYLSLQYNLDHSFTEDCLIFTNLDNGDQRVDVDFSKLDQSKIYGSMYFCEDYFGKKYPFYYLIKHEDVITVHRPIYEISYTDWVDKGTTFVKHSADLKPIEWQYQNLNTNGSRYSQYFCLSQTLFNDDDSYEYIVPKYKLVEGKSSGETSVVNPYEIVLTRSYEVPKSSTLALCGFQVVGEKGNVIQDIIFDNYLGGNDVQKPTILTFGSTTYITFYGNDSDGKSVTVFYKIDRTTSSLQKVRTVPGGMSLSRTIANKGADIQVNFSDGNEKGSEVSVFSANGQKVKSVMVPAGQKSATFNVNGASGMYLVNRTQKGKANDTKKITIK